MPNEKELIDILLGNRGIKEEDREKFLDPKYDDLYDPFLMIDMERACVRIFEAIESKEKIIIYCDYDADGIPSAVMMNDFFHKINYENFSIYIPDRHDEGYGLHMEAIREFIKDSVGLIITFDLGITAIDEVAFAQASGVDVIITDHHLPKSIGVVSEELSLPRAYAILNPKVSDEKNGKVYPDTMLCGAGVCFKLVQALILKYGEYWKISKGWEKWLLDMAGIATLSDQVPLIDENRIIAFYGLKVLRTGVRPGIVEIFNKNSVDFKKLNEDDITFTLTPKINAASRMDDPMNAFLLLASKDLVESKELASHLMKINDERKYLVAQIMKEVKHTLSQRDEKEIIVIGNPKWRIGVLGIVASKIVDEYKRPVFVWGSDGGNVLKGSCRSFGGINLFETMSLLPADSLLEFGGHALAGGFSVSHEKIHLLEDSIVEVFIKHNFTALIKEENMAEVTIDIDDVNESNFNTIDKLAPFGVGNPKPIFLLKNILINSLKEFGKEKNHLEICFLNSRKKVIKAIAFFKTRNDYKGKDGQIIKEGSTIDLLATFEKNTFAGRTELRLRIIDVI